MDTKKYNKNTVTVLLVTCLLLASCSSSRTFRYSYSDNNRKIIRQTLANGNVACENCYFNGGCVQIIDSTIKNGSYELTGKCALYSYHLTAESVDGGSAINIKVKCALIVGRSKTSETYFLDEVGGALFDANKSTVKAQMSTKNKN